MVRSAWAIPLEDWSRTRFVPETFEKSYLNKKKHPLSNTVALSKSKYLRLCFGQKAICAQLLRLPSPSLFVTAVTFSL